MSGENGAGPIRVVIAEDDDDVRYLIINTLEREPSVEVVGEADDGRKAMERVRESAPDCLVIDLHMPGHHGFDAVEQLRAELPRLAIVVLTGERGDATLDRSAEAGADAILDKVDTFDRLVPVITRAVRGRRDARD